ncbi:hypothetical protein ADL04_18055 [Streptomyces sp. NRRL B-3648]|nr:hypothetical protein ADL04_18055 [Streptomyces sp. NRRL B-3648]
MDRRGGRVRPTPDDARHRHQNFLAVYALSSVADLKRKSARGAADRGKSLQRQLEFYRWLRSAEGAIAGGATNRWAGRHAAGRYLVHGTRRGVLLDMGSYAELLE